MAPNNSTVFITVSSETLANQLVYIIEGVLMILTGTILMAVIVLRKTLRERRELLMIAGQASTSLIFGIGNIFAASERLTLVFKGQLNSFRTPVQCLWIPQTVFLISGTQSSALMLAVVSLDRLLAVRWFSYYKSLTNRYAKLVIGVVYGYNILYFILFIILTYFVSQDKPNLPASCVWSQITVAGFTSFASFLTVIAGIATVLIFALTWYYHRKHLKTKVLAMTKQGKGDTSMANQRKFTQIVGITVVFTFFLYVIPNITNLILINDEKNKVASAAIIPWISAVKNVNLIAALFIYIISIKDIRQALTPFLCRKPIYGNTSNTSGSMGFKSGKESILKRGTGVLNKTQPSVLSSQPEMRPESIAEN